ncbi:hypothetical protein D3C76_1408130 [compost metagenome]
MLAQTGNRCNTWAIGIAAGRWQQRRQHPHRALHLGPALTRLELRMGPYRGHVVDLGIGDLRSIQALDHLGDAQPGEGFDDD